MKVIGITGSIATGKSTVAKYIEMKGYKVIDADKESREAVKPGSVGLAAVAMEFGEQVMNSDGTLNREKLAKIVFYDRDKLEKLNSIIHPLVKASFDEKLKKFRQDGESVVFFDCPLLIEADMKGLVDEIWLVCSSNENQLKRLMERNDLSREEAQSRIDLQMSLEEKKSHCDMIINNDDTVYRLEAEIERVMKNAGI